VKINDQSTKPNIESKPSKKTHFDLPAHLLISDGHGLMTSSLQQMRCLKW